MVIPEVTAAGLFGFEDFLNSNLDAIASHIGTDERPVVANARIAVSSSSDPILGYENSRAKEDGAVPSFGEPIIETDHIGGEIAGANSANDPR